VGVNRELHAKPEPLRSTPIPPMNAMPPLPSPTRNAKVGARVRAGCRPPARGWLGGGPKASARWPRPLRVPAWLVPVSLVPALLVPALLVPALLGSGAAATGDRSGAPPQHLPIEGRWCPNGGAPAPGAPARPAACVGLEVPRTWHQYTLGLQLRERLPADRGMWFAYRPAQVARFWMHRTPEPLDMVFVRNGRVIAIEPAAAPCMRLPCPSYGPDEPVDGVLELAAGQASRLGLKVGSPLRVELLKSFGPTAPAPD